MRPSNVRRGGPLDKSRPVLAADAATQQVQRQVATPATVARAAARWHRLAELERLRAQAQRVRQLERSLQARRDAGDREGSALAAAWFAEARGVAA